MGRRSEPTRPVLAHDLNAWAEHIGAGCASVALVAGETIPEVMAELARGKMRDKRATLERALAGGFGQHQRFLVAEVLAQIDFLDETIERLSVEEP